MKAPTYRKHSRGIGFVEFKGKRYYFNGHKFGSPESLEMYADFIRLNCRPHEANQVLAPKAKTETRLYELAEKFLERAEKKYGKAKSNSEYFAYESMLCDLVELFGSLLIRDFGPIHIEEFRQWIIDNPRIITYKTGTTRKIDRSVAHANKLVKRIIHVLKFGVSVEMVTGEKYLACSTVEAQKTKRKKRLPVEYKYVAAVLPHCSQVIKAMILLQWHTGVRSTNICDLTPSQIGRSGEFSEVWKWTISDHKTDGLGEDLIIWIGPKAQEVVTPFLERASDQFCFRVEESTGRKMRRSENYSANTYKQAIQRALGKLADPVIKEPFNRKKFLEAGIHYWTPHQMRHSRATSIRNEFGIEAAQAVLGHASIDATQIYSQRRLELAREIAKKSG